MPRSRRPRQAWWRTVTVAYDFEPHHHLLLEAAGNAWDAMEAARLEIAREGPSYLNKEGEPRPRPECAVLRDSRAAFARIIKDLGLDAAPPPTPRNFASWTPPWKP
jgi:hypothetical protein